MLTNLRNTAILLFLTLHWQMATKLYTDRNIVSSGM